MILNDDFFDELPSDKLEVGIKICRAITKFDSDLKDDGAKFGAYYDYLDALGALTAFVQENPKGFIDLIYIDPPFNSKRNYNVLFESVDLTDSTAQKEAFAYNLKNNDYEN